MDAMETDDSSWKRYGNLVLDLVGFTLLFVFFSAVFSAPLLLFPALQEQMDDAVGLLSELLMVIAAVAAAWGVFRLRRLPFSHLGLSLRGRSSDWLRAAVLIGCLYLTGFVVLWSAGSVEVVGVAFSAEDLLLSLLFFLFVALFEEITFRGFVLGRMLDSGMNPYLAWVLSSLLFSAVHWSNPSFAFLPFFNIFLAGLFLGAPCLFSRNLCLPVALHWFWNWVQGPLLGFNVSGMNMSDKLLQLRISGSELLSGGSFGFEGSLMCTFVLLAGTAIILFAGRRLSRLHA